MDTPGYKEWFRSRIETLDGRKGLLTVGKDAQGVKEGFQWWCFTPDDGTPREDMMIQQMWAGEPKDEERPRGSSPFVTAKSVGGHIFTCRETP